jgi:hypothetical protein
MLKWPERAKSALRKLFEPLQEIDVYVEDVNDEAFYRCLLNGANSNVKIARVFALGGRDAVIAAAQAHDQLTRRALFIIDGDLSWVKGESAPSIIGLHCHDAYCIENLILCEKALVLVLSQEAVVTEKEAAALLDYDKWIRSIETPLIELFSAFATVSKFDPTVSTVSQKVGVMCVNHRSTRKHELDPIKVNQVRLDALKAAENSAESEIVSAMYICILNRLKGLTQPLRAVSGKDFLLPLIDFHLQALGCRVKRKTLRVRLANAGDLTRYAPLTMALNQAAQGYA